MSNITRKYVAKGISSAYRSFSISATSNKSYACKLLVVGGGSAGCTMASKFVRRLPKDSVIVLEPSTDHYYQALFTLVGAGIKRLADSHRFEKDVLPKGAVWLKDRAAAIDPKTNTVDTSDGHTINYEYVIIAVGVKNDYHMIPGLSEALKDENSGVSTIYSPETCEKTWRDFQKFRGGDAIFTFPTGAIKCPGAPQKIAYLADSYFTKTNVRSKTNIMYNTCLPVLFGVKKYADVLLKIAERKNININYRTVLKEIHPEKREAVFQIYKGDNCEEQTIHYDLLHATPPMSTPAFLANNRELTDDQSYLTVDKYTLQHTKYKNIYGLGDCTNTPNSKTAAAIAKQCYVVEHNLLNTMKKDSPKEKYDGYGACPLVTSYNTCVLAEFLYDGVIRETFPFNQERRISFYMKKELFPFIYWHFMLKGYYHGPEFIRKIVNPFAK